MASVTDTLGTKESEHGGRPRFVQHHFDTARQQFEAVRLGMWVFIVTEILMFGGLFVAYFVLHAAEPEVFKAAHRHLNTTMGAANTVVLLFSSLTAALGVRSAQLGRRGETTLFLGATLACAAVFLVIKYFEYAHKIHLGLLPGRCFGHSGFEGCFGDSSAVPKVIAGLPLRANVFFGLYFAMTGLHGLHVLVGMSILAWVLIKNVRGGISAAYFTPVEIGALYWHLVDLVWIYLFPLLYLVS